MPLKRFRFEVAFTMDIEDLNEFSYYQDLKKKGVDIQAEKQELQEELE